MSGNLTRKKAVAIVNSWPIWHAVLKNGRISSKKKSKPVRVLKVTKGGILAIVPHTTAYATTETNWKNLVKQIDHFIGSKAKSKEEIENWLHHNGYGYYKY